MNNSLKNMVLVGVGALVSLGAIGFLFSQVDINEVIENIRQAETAYILILLPLYLLCMYLRSVRWQHLLQAHLPFWRAFHITNIGYFFNAVLPLRLGEVVRILLMSREPNQSAGAGLSALTLERLLDLAFALMCIGIGLVLIPDSAALPAETTSTLGVLIVMTIIGGLGVVFLPRTHPLILRLLKWLSRPLPASLAQRGLKFAEDTLNGLRIIATPRRLLNTLSLSAILWATYYAFFYIGLFAFLDDTPAPGVGLLVTGFIALGIAAPSLPGAIGVFQAAAVLALTTAGYSTAIATSYSWTLWVIEIGAIVLGGIWGLSAMGLSLGGLTRQVRQGVEA